jgi:hypothetical protein
MAAGFNTPGTFTSGDFNYSGMVDIADFAILAGNFNKTLPAPGRAPATAAATAGARPLTTARRPTSGSPFAMSWLDEFADQFFF